MPPANRVARRPFDVLTGAQVQPPLATPAVIMINPKFVVNVSSMIRNCAAFGVSTLCWTGDRIEMPTGKKGDRMPRQERLRSYRTVQVIQDDFPLRLFADTAVPVAVEILPNAESLALFEHPKEAVYVLGPEDGSIPAGMRAACHRFIEIPTNHCLNVAQAGGIVLFHRYHIAKVRP